MKKNIRRFFRALGYDIKKTSSATAPIEYLVKSLIAHKIQVVVDIGANQGQFAKGLRKAGYLGKIISFEPLMDAHKVLLEESRRDNNWHIHERIAIGEFNGTAEINVSKNSVSSSLLSINDLHVEAAPNSDYCRTESVSVSKLDDVLHQYQVVAQNYFIKIDVQGYEKNVLAGAINSVAHASGIHCELSLVELYEGEELWQEMLNKFSDLGYELWSLERGLTRADNGRVLQVDVTLFKNST